MRNGLAADLVASLKYALAKEEGNEILSNVKEGHAILFLRKRGAILQIDSYLPKEDISYDEDGEPSDPDEDGTHDPEKIYLTAIFLDGRKKSAECRYRDKPSIDGFLNEILKN